MPRDPEEARQIAYQVRRYMDHLSDEDLEQRAKDICFNLAIGARADVLANPPPMGWEQLWRDVVDEAKRRFGDVDGRWWAKQIDGECFAKWQARPHLPKDQAASLMQRAGTAGGFFVRYSKRAYLEQLVSRGYVEVRPASSYDDPSLNEAIRDDELRLAIQPNPAEIKIEVFDSRTGEAKGSFAPIGSRVTSVAGSNYYVYCMSGVLAPHLFHDFDADACVLIRDPKVFVERLLDGLNSWLPHPSWGGDLETVKYVDPLNTGIRQFKVYSAKHYRFAYQREFRIVWYPALTTPLMKLGTIRLELGSMRDCCELLCA